jgi:hypothetical protein
LDWVTGAFIVALSLHVSLYLCPIFRAGPAVIAEERKRGKVFSAPLRLCASPKLSGNMFPDLGVSALDRAALANLSPQGMLVMRASARHVED